MNTDDILFMTTNEIAMMIAARAKELRKKLKMNRVVFAEKINVSFGSYQRFEQSGKISFDGLLRVLRGLGRLQDIEYILKMDSIEKVGLREYLKNTTTSKPLG